MDLNQIVYFGKKSGVLSTKRERLFYSLCDGIIGGQGNGPLNPEPLPLGLISFTNTSGWNDLVLSQTMGMVSERIPLLTSARHFEKHRSKVFSLNGEVVPYEEFSTISLTAKMPPGWTEYDKV